MTLKKLFVGLQLILCLLCCGCSAFDIAAVHGNVSRDLQHRSLLNPTNEALGQKSRVLDGCPQTFSAAGRAESQTDEIQKVTVLLRTRKTICSGSLISPEWAISAAHCSVDLSTRVCADITSTGLTICRNVSQIRKHPSFTRTDYAIYNDVMLLKLSTKATHTQGVHLNSRAGSPKSGAIVRAAGYGRRSTAGGGLGVLRRADVSVLSTLACRRKFSSTAAFTAIGGEIDNFHHICANHDTCDTGVCRGDSGGPLFARHVNGQLVLVGITSYGVSTCGSRNTPDVYTRVQSYVRWIQKVTDNGARLVRLEAL